MPVPISWTERGCTVATWEAGAPEVSYVTSSQKLTMLESRRIADTMIPSHVVPALSFHYLKENSELDIPWFARPPVYSENEVEMFPINLKLKKEKMGQEELKLPMDPRRWSRGDVCTWVEWTCHKHGLPLPSMDRFLMNGKAVCLMNANMFTCRVPLGGKMLYKDFQIRLAKALNY